jgi:tRNA-splicing ligase RtcB
MTTLLTLPEIRPRLKDLVTALFQHVPSGVGSTGPIRLKEKEERKVLTDGARWAVEHGYGSAEDLEHTEDGGALPGADPDKVSPRAMERGREQLGTLGSGNHFLEIEVVEEVFDPSAAKAYGLEKGQIAVMLHSGSRGLGHQVCDDYLARMVKHLGELDVELPDRQLACAYLSTPRGQDYLAAMACAANYAWANRQLLMHWVREAFEKTLSMSPKALGMRLLYDICHNIAKIETLPVDGKDRALCVHRKGATRALPAGHPLVPAAYRNIGQPVLIPGDMGSGSYVLTGTTKALEETFGSSCHGAGHEPRPGDQIQPGPLHHQRHGRQGNHCHGQRPGDSRGGNPRGLQESRLGCGRCPPGGDCEESGPPPGPGLHQRLKFLWPFP